MAERREHPRYAAPSPVYGRVRSLIHARIVDVSQGGVQLELSSSLRPGTVCEVAIPTVVGVVQLRAEVRRCRARAVAGADGARLLYFAGLQFERVGAQERDALAAGLDLSRSSTLELGAGDVVGQPRRSSA